MKTIMIYTASHRREEFNKYNPIMRIFISAWKEIWLLQNRAKIIGVFFPMIGKTLCILAVKTSHKGRISFAAHRHRMSRRYLERAPPYS